MELSGINSNKNDSDMNKLLEIQCELGKRGITVENVLELTKDLTEEQKQKLIILYTNQNKKLEANIEKCKNKIISIKEKMYKNME